MVSRRLRNIITVPRRNFNHHFAGLLDHGLTSQTRVELQVGGHVKAVGLFVVHLAEQLFALLHHDVAGGAGAVAAAGVLQVQAEVHGHVQDRLRLAVLLVGQLAVFKFEALVLGKERDANRVRPESFFGRRSAALCFFVWHKSFARGPEGLLRCVPSLKGLRFYLTLTQGLRPGLTSMPPLRARVAAVTATDASQTSGVPDAPGRLISMGISFAPRNPHRTAIRPLAFSNRYPLT